MENAKESSGEEKPATVSHGPDQAGDGTAAAAAADAEELAARPPSRTPFTSLSQVDADLALARALQEQERAYMMLRRGGAELSDYGSSERGSYVEEEEAEDEDEDDEEDMDGPDVLDQIEEGEGSEDGSDYDEDAFDANYLDLDPSAFDSDEAYARALQEAEEREVAARLMAITGLHDWGAADDYGEHDNNSQDAWLEVDPDELSYEELIALGEVVGTESRGLSADTIASLPSVNYKGQSAEDGNTEQCVICRVDYEDGESLVVLSCKHTYHPECINKWLQINKVCPVCSAEVSASENRRD